MRLQPLLERLDAVSPAFIDATLRGAVVLLIALVLTHLLRRRSAALRHLIWVGAVAVQLLLPLFAIWGPKWKVAMPGEVARFVPAEITVQEEAGPSVPSGRQPEVVSVRENVVPTAGRDLLVPPSTPPISGRQLLLALWALGAFVVLARLAIGTSIVARLARKGNRIDDGNWLSLAQKLSASLEIDRPLTLLRGSKLGVPVTWGIVYPIVLLPDDADAWPEERRRFVLVHEMAHVKRLDALTQLAGQFALALFWFNPLVWIANRRMQLEREHACDDYVLRHGTQPSIYAEELLSMVRALGSPSHASAQPAFAALAMARRSEFEGRMLSILDPVLDRHPLSKGRTLLSAAAALLLVVPIAAMHPYRRAEAAPLPPTASVVAPAPKTPVAPSRGMVMQDLPESFKISIEPALKDTAALARALTKPVQKLASSVESLTTAAASMATRAVAAATPKSKTPGCDNPHFGDPGSGSTSLHATENDDGVVLVDYTTTNGVRCLSAMIVGKLKFAPAEDDILDMPFGSHANFRLRTPSEDRELTVSPVSGGGVQRAYRMNGKDATYDADARTWFGSFLPKILSEVGMNVKPRVEHWRADGGVNNVLANIARMNGSSAKRSHYMALFDGAPLSGEERESVVKSASENLRTSSSDLRAVLLRAAPNVKLSRQSLSALERAVASITSSGDKTAVLQAYAATDDREILLAVLRASESSITTGDRARLYQVLAPRYLEREDRVLTTSYFEHAQQITSSGDLRNTLMVALRHAARSPVMLASLIEAARTISSSGDRAAVLISVASSDGVTTKELKDLFFTAASEIPAEGDRARVLQVAARLR